MTTLRAFVQITTACMICLFDVLRPFHCNIRASQPLFFHIQEETMICKRFTFNPHSWTLPVALVLFAGIGHFALAAGIDADIPRLEASAERGQVKSAVRLGDAYFIGRGVEKSEERAAYWYEKAANSGDPLAQKQIGYFYEVGIGVPRDPVRAVRWFERAASGGLASARVNLGVAYLWGSGVPKDERYAIRLFREAADKGCGLGAAYLGDVYYFGIGAERDVAEAEHWYTVGARLHEPQAEFRLAGMLSAGVIPKQDYRKAAALLREAIASGSVPAEHALGLLLANHPDLAENPQEAVRLLERAAASGTWKSSAVLGALARDGRGMPADSKAAYLHFKIAALQGGEEARPVIAADLKNLTAKISDADRADLDGQAVAWMKEHPLNLQFVYKDGSDAKQFPAFALTEADEAIHAGKLISTPLD